MKYFTIFLGILTLVFLFCNKESQRKLNGDLLYLTDRSSVGDFKSVKELVKNGADVNCIDSVINKGSTSLLNAAEGIEDDGMTYRYKNEDEKRKAKSLDEQEAIKIVKFLVEKGAKLDVTDNQGSNALHLAAIVGRPLMIQTLVELGMNIKEKNKAGATTLILAAASGSLEAVNVCVENGADINTKTNENYTALDVARQYGTEYSRKMGISEHNEHKEIIAYLQEKGAKRGEEISE